MKRRISGAVSCILALLLLLSLAACGEVQQSPAQTSQPINVEDAEPIENTSEDDYFDYTNVEMESVESTCFSEIGYDEEYEILLVRFLESGSLYEYYGVPEDVYEDLLYSESPGGYYNDYIKGQYECDRLE